jgi:putative two-component system hydrogenase maturation factor HypX/HoxX
MAQCQRLTRLAWAPHRVMCCSGGADYWSNGIHLNTIEAAASPSDESWANINAIDDLAEAMLRCQSHLTVAALRAGAGAGGCFLARAADDVWVREGVLLNPHYKNMGNLYGSEFWTSLLPPRVGEEGARAIMQRRLPMTARESVACGFYDACLAGDPAAFRVDVARRAALPRRPVFGPRWPNARWRRRTGLKPLARTGRGTARWSATSTASILVPRGTLPLRLRSPNSGRRATWRATATWAGRCLNEPGP